MIPLVKTYLPEPEKLMPELERVLYSGYIAQGEEVENFEKALSNYIGNPYVVTVNSGSSALHIALILAGVKQGDEVISTPLTAEPTNTVISQTGAKIIWADIDPKTGNACPADVLSKVTENTKAIVVVDYAGIPVDVKAFQDIQNKTGVTVIQDSAHAFGASYDGSKLGNHFDFTIFSFQAIKHMTTIDGGLLCVNNKTRFEEAKLIRWFGLDKSISRDKNLITTQGYKYHMNDVNATVGLVQLQGIDDVIRKYIDNGKFYDRELQGIDGLDLLEIDSKSEPSYWLYTIKVRDRDAFIKKLHSHGIMASPLHKRNDLHPLLGKVNDSLPNLEEFSKTWVHIPCGWWVDEASRQKIVSVIKGGW
ncbi:DegT/DnrJ/EryC1/StrS family aminotransferase [Vibrio vulnificus]|uniref:DegT/DnrJ/EryC1/StrS family aminotransferase n=1 Tax=Vibrio vulnificus TaxID=672 RepID=UPI0007EE543B|nr:DegT/DnrJ/EryC1/StrS family aminotransferase [Vibrio vulnificus]ANN27789.1 aminotransferase DegT [Vibrio vulnificus]MCU8408567.1 DegT/DnrJ/EryC1/StrS family aminotransferase [Vibrio vulnificus]